MKSFLTCFIILGFASVAILSIFTMGYGENGHRGCLAAAANGGNCPEETGFLSFLNFHFNAFKSFSTAIFGDSSFSLAFFFAALLILISNRLIADFPLVEPEADYRQSRIPESIFTLKRDFAGWLALHENSPAVF